MMRATLLSGLLILTGSAGSPGPAVRPAPVPPAYASEDVAAAEWSPERADLGEQLFFEEMLSGDRTVSCASCHDPEKAFTDGRAIAVGAGGRIGRRNTPTILNRALGKSQFWDGRAASLEEQALGPIANPREMDLPVEEAVARLRQDPRYLVAFRRAFGGDPSAPRLAAALAAYERTVYSVDSPFDRFLAGDEGALSPAARRGLALFGGKARCGECHTGANMTDELFHSIGVESEDQGRALVTGKDVDRGTFKTPTLRDVARTAPYMHNGSQATLRDVVDYYNDGGRPHANLSPKVQVLGLTDGEKADLVAFLEALSGRIAPVSAAALHSAP